MPLGVSQITWRKTFFFLIKTGISEIPASGKKSSLPVSKATLITARARKNERTARMLAKTVRYPSK